MDDRVGQQLGNYRLSRLLGKGGFAEVYLGEHVYLRTPAAIKLLQAKVQSPEDLEDFLKEAQTIAQLVHPHIVRVMDFGVDGDTPFLVMDYASGGTLRQRHPKGQQLPLSTILPYIKQIAEALQYAHDEHFIHRDVKPENMLVGRRDGVLLSDFGIALIAQSSRYQSTQEVIGTVAYMSPEQIQGKPRPASDQYSLAVVVYEWLRGDRPFHGSFTELCTQHMFASPPPLREKIPTISPAVEQVVMTALTKDPKQRFASVQAFATALEQASRVDQPHSSILSQPLQALTMTSPAMPLPQQTVTSSPVEGVHTLPATPDQSRQVVSSSRLQNRPEPVSQGISRRAIILGLGAAGLALVGVVGGGIALLSHTQGSQISSPPSTPLPTAHPTSGPTITSILHATVATPPSKVNLTSEGTSDWIHWGLYTGSTVDRKNEVPLQISTFSTIGNATARAYSGNYVAYSWSDGTPDRTIANTTTAVYVSGVNNGFSFSVPARTTTQTLRVYVDVYLSHAKFTASLTNGSGLVYTDESLNNTGGVTQAVYTLTYRSSSNGQQLTITFVEVDAYNGVANVALGAATLQ